MDISTYFIENKALFGPYPTQDDVHYFENIGVKYFIDLTEMNKLPPYKLSDTSTFIKFPIPDMTIPLDIVHFSSFIVYLDHILKNLKDGEKIYVHCRGGNGRSGIVVACLLVRYQSITALDALQLTQKYHSERKNLKLKWKLMGAPQTYAQKNFVIKLFTPFCFYKDVLYGSKYGFVPYSKIPVQLDDKSFDDSQSAYNYLMKNTPYMKQDMYDCMKHIQSLKINQSSIFYYNLLNTSLRPIIYCNNYDKYWGTDKVGNGNNYLGNILVELRDELLLTYYLTH